MIIIEKPNFAFLPEVNAYQLKLEKNGFRVKIVPHYNGEYCDLLIKFPGSVIKKHNYKHLIVDYNSLSIGNFNYAKNIIKNIMSRKADGYIFLNEFVKSNTYYNKLAPHIIRDMGISDIFINKPTYKDITSTKNRSICYVGAVVGRPGLIEALCLLETSGLEVHIVGDCGSSFSAEIQQKFNFLGKIPQSDLPKIMMKYDLLFNYIPDQLPFKQQTSTKLLEYLCFEKPIISNRTPWIMAFLHQQLLTYEKCDFQNDWIQIQSDNFRASTYSWDQVLDVAGFIPFIERILNKEC